MRDLYQLALPLRSRGPSGRWSSPYAVSNPLTAKQRAAVQGGSVGEAMAAAAAAAARGELPRIAVSPGQLGLDFSGGPTRTLPEPLMTTSTPMAGNKLIGFLLTNPLGEEILEGTMGGLLAGVSQIGSDQPLGQTALETATAIAGGIGMGMLGRRVGARVGQMVHEDPLRNQKGMLAMLGRTLGSETTGEGLKKQGAMLREAIHDDLLQGATRRMIHEAATDPAAFTTRYGITPDQFTRVLPHLRVGQDAASVLKRLESLSPEQRKRALDVILGDYTKAESSVRAEAADSMNRQFSSAAEKYKDVKLPGVDQSLGDVYGSMLDSVADVTGRDVGRAVGRLVGDEVGVIGGMTAGSLLAQQLGFETEKDRRIRELEAQLQQVSR